jgi:hypothetical protein
LRSGRAWRADLKPPHLERIVTRTIERSELPAAFEDYLKGRVTGRTVVRIGIRALRAAATDRDDAAGARRQRVERAQAQRRCSCSMSCRAGTAPTV